MKFIETIKKHRIISGIFVFLAVAFLLFLLYGALSGEIKKFFRLQSDSISINDVNDLIKKSEERQNRLRDALKAEIDARAENERVLIEELRRIQEAYGTRLNELNSKIEVNSEKIYKRYENDVDGLTREASKNFGFPVHERSEN